MSKLTYLKSYFVGLCNKYKPSEAINEALYFEFEFNASEKGTLYARYQLLNKLKK